MPRSVRPKAQVKAKAKSAPRPKGRPRRTVGGVGDASFLLEDFVLPEVPSQPPIVDSEAVLDSRKFIKRGEDDKFSESAFFKVLLGRATLASVAYLLKVQGKSVYSSFKNLALGDLKVFPDLNEGEITELELIISVACSEKPAVLELRKFLMVDFSMLNPSYWSMLRLQKLSEVRGMLNRPIFSRIVDFHHFTEGSSNRLDSKMAVFCAPRALCALGLLSFAKSDVLSCQLSNLCCSFLPSEVISGLNALVNDFLIENYSHSTDALGFSGLFSKVQEYKLLSRGNSGGSGGFSSTSNRRNVSFSHFSGGSGGTVRNGGNSKPIGPPTK